jgi:hypothetical protein
MCSHPIDLIALLPDAAIAPDGPVAAAFRGHGITSFQEACRWVKELPYGSGSDGLNALALFDDHRGTCMTKHAAIARLAAEMRLPVFKQLAFYRLTEEIVTGIGELLRPYGLDFVPQMHCFLEYHGHRIDLTADDCNGKNKPLEEFDFVVPVAPESTRGELEHYYQTYLQRYAAIEPKFAAISRSDFTSLLTACHRQMNLRCEVQRYAAQHGESFVV